MSRPVRDSGSTRRVLPAALLICAAVAMPAAVLSAAAADKPAPPPASPPPAAPSPDAPQGAERIMAPTPRPAAPRKAAPPPGPTTLEPRAWPRSTYAFDGRVEISVGNASFEAPPAYQQSFEYWIGRMRGTIRTEMLQAITSTEAAASGARLPYHRQITRYSMEMNERGELKESGRPLVDQVLRLKWEGDLDARGNVATATRSNAPEDTREIDRLSFPLLDNLFPRVDGARTLKGGESFVETISMPLPTQLSVKGLEAQRMRVTRRFTLREVAGTQARFEVRVDYAPDPATPPTAPRTSIAIAGGGDGDAEFDLEVGAWVNVRTPTQMTIDIEAPLRVLPGQPEGVDPGTAKTHLPIGLTLSGKRTVTRLFDDPPLAAPAPAAAPPAPAAGTPPAAPSGSGAQPAAKPAGGGS